MFITNFGQHILSKPLKLFSNMILLQFKLEQTKITYQFQALLQHTNGQKRSSKLPSIVKREKDSL